MDDIWDDSILDGNPSDNWDESVIIVDNSLNDILNNSPDNILEGSPDDSLGNRGLGVGSSSCLHCTTPGTPHRLSKISSSTSSSSSLSN